MSIWIIAIVVGAVIGLIVAVRSAYPRLYKALGVFILWSIAGFLVALTIIALINWIR